MVHRRFPDFEDSFSFFQPNWRADYSWPPPWEVDGKTLRGRTLASSCLTWWSIHAEKYKITSFALNENVERKWNKMEKLRRRPQFEEEGRRWEWQATFSDRVKCRHIYFGRFETVQKLKQNSDLMDLSARLVKTIKANQNYLKRFFLFNHL